MLNPLSLQLGQKITGKEINDWCRDQIENNRSKFHRKYAEFFLSKHYRDDRIYYKSYKAETAGGVKSYVIVFERCEEEFS